MNQPLLLSIVVPVFNEIESIHLLYSQLKTVLEKERYNYEVVFVDDGSTDNTFALIKKLNLENKRVRGLSFSKNFGHQIALLAGLKNSKGDLVITMDGDGQHPADFIPALIQKQSQGFDIVNTIRSDSPDTGVFKKLSSKWFYKIINVLSEVEIVSASADFRIMNRKAVEAFIAIPETDRFTRGLISWMGFNQAVISYAANSRLAGKSKFSFSKMLRFAINGITSFSAKPLRFSLYLGVLVAGISVVYAIYAIAQFVRGHVIPGWTSILLSVLFIGGSILINMGIMGEYIARIFSETKNRPLYFIKDQTEER